VSEGAAGAGTPGHGSTLAELGARLRQARVKKGWTVQQASERTRITVKHLVALESGDVSGMPAPVYVRGFVRGYAKALDLPEDEMLRPLDDAGIRPATVPVVTDRPVETAGWRPAPQTLAIAGAVLAGGIVLGLGIRGFIRFMGSAGDGAVPPSPFAAPVVAPKSRHAAEEPQQTEAPPAASAAPTGARLESVLVSVTALQECWVEWQIDTRRSRNEILKSGEARTYRGDIRVRLLIGNPAGLDVSGPFGRVPLPKQAPRGIHLLFTRQGVQPLEIPPLSSTQNTDTPPHP